MFQSKYGFQDEVKHVKLITDDDARRRTLDAPRGTYYYTGSDEPFGLKINLKNKQTNERIAICHLSKKLLYLKFLVHVVLISTTMLMF